MRGIRLTLVVAAVALVFAAACVKDEQPGTRPTGTLSPSMSSARPFPSASSTAGLSEKEQIEAIYTEYTMRRPEVQDLPKDQRRKFFLQWTAEPFTSDVMKALEYDKAHQIRAYGTVEVHVFSVQIEGNAARVDDCLDQTNFGYRDARTGAKITPHPEDGEGLTWVATRLDRKADGWRITGSDLVEKRCTV